MSGIADLIERLEKMKGPDRDTDADIYIAFNIPADRAGRIDRLGGCVGWWPKDAPYVSAVDVPSYTASLDAATALVKRVLPGWSWECRESGTGDKGQATVWNPHMAPGYNDEQRAYNCPSPAISLCLALLRALQQEEKR